MSTNTPPPSLAVKKLLESTKCLDLLKGQEVIEIDANESIAKGCQTLVAHGISSAPVFNSDNNEYVGMLDYRDIVDYVLTVFHKKRLEPISEDEVIGIADIVHKAMAGEAVTTEAIVDLSRKNPFYSVMTHSSLEAAVDIFSSNLGIHRVNVVNDKGRVAGIISKTDIIRFFLHHIDVFGDLEKQNLSELGLGKGPVVAVNSNSSVLDALERMSEYSVSSLPVVDSSNRLVGNISMADVRFVFQHNRFNRLWLTCSNFISLALSQKGLEHHGQDTFPVFDVTLDVSLGKVIQKLLATKTHRMWVVDNAGHLQGVVSMTDIIRRLCKPNRPSRSSFLRT